MIEVESIVLMKNNMESIQNFDLEEIPVTLIWKTMLISNKTDTIENKDLINEDCQLILKLTIQTEKIFSKVISQLSISLIEESSKIQIKN